MKVRLENGEFAEDGYYPWNMWNSNLGMDSGLRSRENSTAIHRQATLSRLDEVSFYDIIDNKDYYEIDGEKKRYYCLCSRCGYVPLSKRETYENTRVLYYDLHCKCGNAMTYADFSEEEIYKIKEEDRERKCYDRIFYDFEM